MKLINNSENGLMHKIGEKVFFLASGAVLDVPKDIANIWLKIKNIKKYVEPKDLEKAKDEAAALKEEIKKLKSDIAKAKEAKPKAKTKTTKSKSKTK